MTVNSIKAYSFIKHYRLDYFFIFIIALVVFFYLQSPATLPDPDSFYHAKIAELIRDQGIVKSFPWAQFSTLKDNFIDHHFLYHLFLIPFTVFFEPLIAIKIATIFLDILLILTIYWLLDHFKIRGRFLWALLFLAVNPFIFRISLAKAPALSIIILLIAFYALVNYRRWLVFALSFFYVWAYGGWPLLWIITFIYLLIDYLFDKFKKEALFWHNLKLIISRFHPQKKTRKRKELALIVFLGTVAGLVINPYFPKNIYFYYQQIYQIAIVNLQNIIGVGGEWYPYGFWSLVRDTGMLFPVLIISLVVFILSFKKQSRLSVILFFIATFFFIYTLKARRSVEYFVPFSLLFASFSFHDFLKEAKTLVKRKINQRFLFGMKNLFLMVFTLIIVIWLVFSFKTWQQVRNDMKNSTRINYFQPAATWLKANTPAGAIVLHSDWDELPILFYFNDHNYYINGLDQTFMYNFNKNVFWLWMRITQGEYLENLTMVIKNNFRASYIFIENGHWGMEALFANNPDFSLVYQDGEVKIYQVK